MLGLLVAAAAVGFLGGLLFGQSPLPRRRVLASRVEALGREVDEARRAESSLRSENLADHMRHIGDLSDWASSAFEARVTLINIEKQLGEVRRSLETKYKPLLAMDGEQH